MAFPCPNFYIWEGDFRKFEKKRIKERKRGQERKKRRKKQAPRLVFGIDSCFVLILLKFQRVA